MLSEGTNDSAAQVSQVETLISQKPDVLVILPHEGGPLTPIAQKAMQAGIPGRQHRPRVLEPDGVPDLDRR
jgi:ribose transport system substrate-binding protein